MVQWLKPPAPARATNDVRRSLWWIAAGFAALVAAAPAPAPAQLVLPAPTTDPRSIDFTRDPVLAFVGPGADDADFTAAVAAAVARTPALAEARAGADAARAGRREIRAGLFPTLSASLVASRSLDRAFTDSSVVVERLLPKGRSDASIGANVLLFDFGATGGRITAAAARLRAATADTDRTAAANVLGAVQAWYQIVGYQALIELSDALVARHRTILAETRARVDAGLGAGGDIVRAEAGLADAIGDGTRDARSLAAARARYHELFGAEAPRRPQRPAAVPITLSADAAIARSRHAPEVVGAEALGDAARAEARAVRGDALPRLSADLTATRFNVFQPGPNHDVRGQLLLRQTFSTGGAETARIAGADARARAAAAAAEQARAEAARDAEAACADARILDVAVTALADAYRANRRNRDMMAEQVRVSRGTLIDLLRTETDYFAAARALVLGSIERDLAAYTLLDRTGALLGHFAIPSAR